MRIELSQELIAAIKQKAIELMANHETKGKLDSQFSEYAIQFIKRGSKAGSSLVVSLESLGLADQYPEYADKEIEVSMNSLI